MATLTRTIANTTGSIPAANTITGSVTTDANSTKVLQYSGTTNLSSFTTTGYPVNFVTGLNDATTGQQGYMYIFIPRTGDIAKIVGFTFLALTSGTYTYALQIDKALAGLSGETFEIIVGNDFSYSYTNVGGASATIDGATVVQGQSNAFPFDPDFQGMASLYRPVYVDASSTTVSIQEFNDNPEI